MIVTWVLLAAGVLLLVIVVANLARHARRLARTRTAAASAMSVHASALRAGIGRRTSSGSGLHRRSG